MNEQDRYQRARQRVQDRKGFYIHLIVFFAINAGLFAVNALVSPGNWWFLWVPVIWGICLAIHALTIFGLARWFGPDWEERETRDLLERDKLNG